MFRSMKSKLTIPIVGMMVLMVVFIFVYVSMATINLADDLTQERINLASNAAEAQLDQLEEQTRVVAYSIAGNYAVVSNLVDWNANPGGRAYSRQAIIAYLQSIAGTMGVDSFVVRDAQGVVVLRMHDLAFYGDQDGTAAGLAALRGETSTSYSSTATMPMGLNTTVPIIHHGAIIGTMTPIFFLHTDVFVDNFASVFNAEVTVFGGSRSVATTLLTAAGARAVGVDASAEVAEAVLRQGRPLITEIELFGVPYHAYYMPLIGAGGNPVGMFFVGFSNAETIAATNAVQRNMIVIGIVSLSVVAVAMLLFILRLTQPLTQMKGVADSLSNMDFTVNIKKTSNDEIGGIQEAMTKIRDSLKKGIDDMHAVFEKDKVAQKEREESFRARMQTILDASPMLCIVYDTSGNVLEVNKEAEPMFGISSKQEFISNMGNFVPKSQPDGSDTFQKWAAIIAKSKTDGIAKYEWDYRHSDGSKIPTEEIVSYVQIDNKDHFVTYSRDLRQHYRELEKERVVQEKIQNMMEQLNDHVEKQAASVATSSSATEEMIANIQSVTDTLSKNTQNVRELQEASEAGHSSLNDVVADIQGIARESESLMEINSVMENIASQTNLLSMNAAIEAAHAGESGRGFAVVADEIRKLAESSSQQSKTIGGVLRGIKESIDNITKSTDTVLGKFDAIGDGVKTVARQENVILSAMEEQGQGSKQILQAVSTVNEITHQVRESARRMVETSTEAMHKTDAAESAAYTDAATGVRNREYFNRNAEQEMRYCVEEDRDFNLILLAVDNLGQVAPEKGMRDDVLKILMQRVRNTLKQGTLVARYSDEEFVITLPNVRSGTALKLAEQVQKKVGDAPFATKSHRLDVSISLGIASKSSTCKTLRDILGNAGKALSNAKASGKNKLVSFG